MRNRALLLIGLLLFTGSCRTLQPYEKTYLNDTEMQFLDDGTYHFPQYMQSIREGMVPAASPKAGSGCGCN